MSTVIAFQSGVCPDDKARYLHDLQQQPVSSLEKNHDFIQWLFPIPEKSTVNPAAPILQFEDALVIRADLELRTALLCSLDTMCTLYGITRKGDLFFRSAHFPGPYLRWLDDVDHNHLRLTRILRCLFLCGLDAEARGLLAFLEDIAVHEAFGRWQIPLLIGDPPIIRRPIGQLTCD